MAFTALTLYQYTWPFVRPVSVNVKPVGEAIRPYEPPTVNDLYTLYPVIELFPVIDGTSHVRTTTVLPAAAWKFCGAPGLDRQTVFTPYHVGVVNPVAPS
jgi:hypothetical protein